MKISLDLQNTKVYDDVLDKKQFDAINTWMSDAPYVWKHTTGEWNKVWSITDGEVLHSKQILLDKNFELKEFFPELQPLMPYFEKLKTLVKDTGLFNMSEVNSTIITPYVYPAGTSLCWHNDSNYIGAFTFYVHNYWNSNWQGEFLTVEGNEYIPEESKTDIKWKIFDNSKLENMILEKGVGHFVMPKPNRIIFNKSGKYGILHKVNKSTLQASERLTLQGFLRKEM